MVQIILRIGNPATIHVALAVVDHILYCYIICHEKKFKYNTGMMLGEKDRFVYWF